VRATIAAETLARAGQRGACSGSVRLAAGEAAAARGPQRARRPAGTAHRRAHGLTGVTLGVLVNAWFLAVAAFFGAGLTFAGATGTCGLALMLMKMPWNRPLTSPPGEGAVCAAGGGAPPTCAAP
jgi:hypothetical protein